MILLIFSAIIYFLPGLWVNYTLNKHNDILTNMPFTAKEFGDELLKEEGLNDVKIETTKEGDHYDLLDKAVRVDPSRLDRKSLTSITVMCHEIGHAIQHKEKYPPLERRYKIAKVTNLLTKLSTGITYVGIPTIIATGALSLIRVCLIAVFASILISMIIHLMTLDVELDASFKRAMPILEKKNSTRISCCK